MGKIITQCPSCSGVKLNIARIECGECQTNFEGTFEVPSLLRLSEEDLAFVLDFVKCSGSLKEMAKIHGVSYPTLRNRLNELISNIEELEKKTDHQKDEILKMLEAGKISAKEAAKKLKNL